MADNYLCIHGHFYQPPRENPWLEFIERQDSAHPFHDWNARITRECYGTNARARLQGAEGRIKSLINNYEYMSFNFGPTLLSWLEKTHPWVYREIVSADKAGRQRYGGHGNALAQVYNHVIMPLASALDKLTQIRWGLSDFKHRFGRPAEGMWVAETAVDRKTLGLMAQEGVKFTILSPDQAKRIRPLNAKDKAAWEDVSGGRIDPLQPYRVRLDDLGTPHIDIFFYYGPISRAVAYEKLLVSGEGYLARIKEAFPRRRDGARLLSVATDGESYGHHSVFGEMALAWLFQRINESKDIDLTNYGLFLERFPPEYEVELVENSSWSCAHGVERWRTDCGCHVSQRPGWNQAWRKPLREGLEWLADELKDVFEKRGGLLLKDPWAARDDYVHVLLRPTPEERERFIERHGTRALTPKEKVEVLQLMESQRMAMYMFTSCGWFFDDISGLEATQVLKYAARAIALGQPWIERDLEAGLLDWLVKAKCNDTRYRDGGEIYESLVKPSRSDATHMAANYGLTSLIGQGQKPFEPLEGKVRSPRQRRLADKGWHVFVGEAEIVEAMTGDTSNRTFAAIKQDHTELACIVAERLIELDLDGLANVLGSALREGTRESILERVSRYLPSAKRYGLEDLIPDARHRILSALATDVRKVIGEAMEGQRDALDELLGLCRLSRDQVPESLYEILCLRSLDELEAVLSSELPERAIDWSASQRLLLSAVDFGVVLKGSRTFKERLREVLEYVLGRLASRPELEPIRAMTEFLKLVHQSNLGVDLWKCQNIFYDKHQDPEFVRSLPAALAVAFKALGRELGFAIEVDERAAGAKHKV